MLSPHEFAALLLVGGKLNLDELDRGDLASLVERQLVVLEKQAARLHLRLTERGDSLVKAVTKRPR